MSLDFDGVNDVVSIADQTTTQSVSAWIYPRSLGESNAGRIIAFGAGVTSLLRFAMDATNTISWIAQWSGTGGVWTAPNDAIVLNAWNHVGATYSINDTSNDPNMYVNGELVEETETSTPVGTLSNANQTLYVGNTSTGDRTFDGLIGELVVYPTILTAPQMRAIATAGAGAWLGIGAPAHTMLYWPLGHAGAADATDFSGNARHGTISGAVVGANPPIRPCGRRG